MKIKQFISNYFRTRKPWSLASDILFAALIVMLLVPSTRSLLLAGVAGVRTVFSSTGSVEEAVPLSEAAWSWQLTDQQGRKAAFASFKGEVIFLNQWATWCPPCRAELSSIEKLYRRYGGRVKFVLLTGEDPAIVKQFLDSHGYTFPVYYGNVSGDELRSRTIPATVIIGRKGGVVMERRGAYNWNARKVRQLIELSAL